VSAEALAAGHADTVTVSTGADDAALPAPAPDEAADERIGRRCGHFHIIRRLGRGGMGAVYQALDESLQRYVALKVIHAAGAAPGDSPQIERLQQEAIAQARLNHPHVVHIYYVGREGQCPFFAMELVPGPTLAERLTAGPLPFAHVVALGEQVAGALQHAARYDIVHGDIKPSNLLLADDLNVKLSDFGLARRISRPADDPDWLAGTPQYLSPEAAEGRPLDLRSDIYSLGVTLFEMTFGRLPYSFSSQRLHEYLKTHRTAPIEFPDPWPESVPWGWRSVLERLLAKAPEERFQNYEEVLATLRRLRPVSRPRAGRVQRALAWLVDLGLAHACQQLFYAPLLAAGASGFSLVRLPLALAGGLVPLLGAYLQVRWKTTPGKRLFQLQIVDRHGTEPCPAALAGRSAAQFLPLWAATAWHVSSALGVRPLGALIGLGATLALLVDAALALFERQGRTLHDQIFRTQVVLQGPSEPSPEKP
jgi:uncharacterized RDD family membrane protein YckC